MKASHAFSAVSQSFDEPNLVSHGGLLTAAVLTERIGLWPLIAGTLTVPGPTGVNSAAKTATVLAGMLSGADSIDDLDVLRAGATPLLFDDLRAPSTIGSWLRAFTHGNVRQLDAVSRQVRCRLWAAGAGPHRLDERLFIDADSTIARAYGPAKQGVSFGYTKVRGYHPLIATALEPGSTPEILHTRLRGDRANTRPRRRQLHRRGDRPLSRVPVRTVSDARLAAVSARGGGCATPGGCLVTPTAPAGRAGWSRWWWW